MMPRASPGAGALQADPSRLLPGAERTLAGQLAAWLRLRIDEPALKPGTRLPSIRRFAEQQRVSRSAVVEAYDRLIAEGSVESRRGSGCFVRARRSEHRPATAARATGATAQQTLDVVWLLRSMLRQSPASDHPGAGLLPPAWLDGELVAASVRAVGRSAVETA
jgi:DNA-binding GntR family transcriptional regulator